MTKCPVFTVRDAEKVSGATQRPAAESTTNGFYTNIDVGQDTSAILSPVTLVSVCSPFIDQRTRVNPFNASAATMQRDFRSKSGTVRNSNNFSHCGWDAKVTNLQFVYVVFRWIAF